MSDFKKGERVYLRDYPLGRPLKVSGIVVGVLPGDFYSVKIETGFLEGQIKKYKYWNLYSARLQSNE